MKFTYKKIISILLAVLILLSFVAGLASCSGDEPAEDKFEKESEVYEISFSKANSVEEMREYDGKKVSVIGYMSTLSPISGSYIYLMNMPYQSCPFCVPNTTQLSNTLAVYAPKGKSFEYTELLIRVDGILDFGDYTDEYGYQYSYRIKDATYKTVDASELPEKYKLWQQFAANDIVSDVYAMYDYLSFVCSWGTYVADFGGNEDYIWPDDAKDFIATEGYQFHYGYKDGYFEGLIADIEAVDKDAFQSLEDNILLAKQLAAEATADLFAGEYESVSEYSKNQDGSFIFGDGREQYRLTNQAEYVERMDEIFSQFAAWIAEWEL